VLLVACATSVESKSRYFHVAKLLSVDYTNGEQRYRIDEPMGILIATQSVATGSSARPALLEGEIRVSIEGNTLYYLDQRGKQYKARIVKRQDHPPPAPVH
jgi:hypothetical protein